MRRITLRLVFALCAAVLAAAGLGAAAAPAGASTGFGGAGLNGAGPAVALAPHSASYSGTAGRSRPAATRTVTHTVAPRSGENSAPASVAALRAPLDGLPSGTLAALLALAPLLIPVGRALTSAPTRGPPAVAGLPETRAPPTSGRL
ncbi:hypothetical protein [Cryptosporangium phraense]|uniref:Uncharacterized protein n=1 Tax=Cryptosporangium phraense TaxID=2593070 RepID=A0A545ASY9_9ACTN|nr:hypothetical protein [Cryptosporangium phraense]TQS44459.1 hypothetical protein FL583_13405 [Cryptosporangium phraense]